MNTNDYYPNNAVNTIKVTKLIKTEDKRLLPERMSTRMVRAASVIQREDFIGWQIFIPAKGLADITVFGSSVVYRSDLEWIVEKTGQTSKNTGKTKCLDGFDDLYEVFLPVAENNRSGSSIGFVSDTSSKVNTGLAQWPMFYSSQFAEFVDAVRFTGGVIRFTVAPSDEVEKECCRKHFIKTFVEGNLRSEEYYGNPVRVRILLRLPKTPSIRLQTILEEFVDGAKFRFIGKMNKKSVRTIWDEPLKGAQVLPDFAARFMMMEPEVSDSLSGIEVCEEEVKPQLASHKNSKDKMAITIGKAIDTAGKKRKIIIGENDLRRHYQIVGQTGTGKSTLLATLILSAIEKGFGLTFFDPHGSTIDSVLHSLPEKYTNRVQVVRIGDAENPVPLGIWDSDDPAKEERNISDLCELFSDIFNTNSEMIVGPRYERWLSTFAKASIALLGRQASLESIEVLSRSKDNMKMVYDVLNDKYSDIATTIKEEYIRDYSDDFQSVLNYYLCKFQRLTSVEQLRKTIGAGTNALDLRTNIDTDTVTLIDLAMPTIGVNPARIIGTLTLMKLWNAAMRRQDRNKTHLVIIDEASLFQTNPLPRMLAESRKFGLSLILCHQYTSQMADDIRNALEANSANFSAFRLSAKDAAIASIRFDRPDMVGNLTRLNAFNAMTTLSVDGIQSSPFTLMTSCLKENANGEETASKVEQQSIEKLVVPNLDQRAMTESEIQKRLEQIWRDKLDEERLGILDGPDEFDD